MALPMRLARHILMKSKYAAQSFDIPTFLCPVLLSYLPKRSLSLKSGQRRCLHMADMTVPTPESPLKLALPILCTGCGAYAQTYDQEKAGFYSLNRKTVKAFLQGENISEGSRRRNENEIVMRALQSADIKLVESLSFGEVAPETATTSPTPTKHLQEQILCDRCHRLTHHSTGVSIHHPSIASIQDTLYESPYKYNHIYHVLDAADFPMSLIPRIHELLDITPQRSHNRRSRSGKFIHGKKTEMSFIITRSDLLAPLKTQVDSLMPWLVEVLRDALGRDHRDVRLGNVRCVSATRDWWTKDLKEDIWARGGGGWMVGKVNVGKSRLFAKVFPKGRSVTAGNVAQDRGKRTATDEDSAVHDAPAPSAIPDSPTIDSYPFEREIQTEHFDPDALLPPALPEVNYPAMPLVSSLPGTTAGPIRVPYGNGKGELIDLPGLSRGDLESFVQPDHRISLVMRSRVVPEQRVIKPGQSLLLGGLIRITPLTPDLIFLGYSFTSIPDHLTSTEKAIAIQQQHAGAPEAHIIALPQTAGRISSAGKFKLQWDVTKQRSGPVTRPNAGGVKVESLPYRVLSTDILIEGCGWVELVAQVRKRNLGVEVTSSQHYGLYAKGDEANFPEVEIFSPEGRFVASRRPMNGWLLGGPRKRPANARTTRPRPSKKGEKKRLKRFKR